MGMPPLNHSGGGFGWRWRLLPGPAAGAGREPALGRLVVTRGRRARGIGTRHSQRPPSRPGSGGRIPASAAQSRRAGARSRCRAGHPYFAVVENPFALQLRGLHDVGHGAPREGSRVPVSSRIPVTFTSSTSWQMNSAGTALRRCLTESGLKLMKVTRMLSSMDVTGVPPSVRSTSSTLSSSFSWRGWDASARWPARSPGRQPGAGPAGRAGSGTVPTWRP